MLRGKSERILDGLCEQGPDRLYVIHEQRLPGEQALILVAPDGFAEVARGHVYLCLIFPPG
jgi:hypothetical protein